MILKQLSLQSKLSKAKPPNQRQIWLGKLYDTVLQQISLPEEKVRKYIDDLTRIRDKNSIKQRYLLKHIGRTRHMATIYRSLSAFARNLESWAYKVHKLEHYIKITRAFRDDIDVCIWAMDKASKFEIPFSFILKPLNNPDIIIYTDASSKIGVDGWSNHGHYFQCRWTSINLSIPHLRDIQWMELSAIYVAIMSLQQSLLHKVIHIFTDNEAVKYMLIKMRSDLKRPDLQSLINEICKSSIDYQFNMWIEYSRGGQCNC